MSVKVHLKHLHISPRKVRLVADLVRGMDALEAEKILQFTSKKSAISIGKLLKSAIATAKNDYSFAEDNLLISEILVNEGPTLKRWRPRAHGRAFPIMKRTSHITIVLNEKVKSESKLKKKSEKKDKAIETKVKEEVDLKSGDKKSEVIKKGYTDDIRKDQKPEKSTQKGILKKVFRRKSG